MKVPFNYSFCKTASGKFIGFAHEFKGVATQADTKEELEERLKDAVKAFLAFSKMETNKIIIAKSKSSVAKMRFEDAAIAC